MISIRIKSMLKLEQIINLSMSQTISEIVRMNFQLNKHCAKVLWVCANLVSVSLVDSSLSMLILILTMMCALLLLFFLDHWWCLCTAIFHSKTCIWGSVIDTIFHVLFLRNDQWTTRNLDAEDERCVLILVLRGTQIYRRQSSYTQPA